MDYCLEMGGILVKKKTLMAFTLSLFMSCLVMMSTLNTANAGKCQFTTVSEMVNALEGDYEIVWAGPIWDHERNNRNGGEVDLFSKDVGAVVRIEAVLDSNELRNLVGYVIKDVPGSANRAVESISNFDEWIAGWETTIPVLCFEGIDFGERREELDKDLAGRVDVRSKNGIEGTEWSYNSVSESTYYELAGNQLNLYYEVYNNKTKVYDRIYFMKLRRVG